MPNLLKTEDFKLITVIVLIGLTYAKCATIHPLPNEKTSVSSSSREAQLRQDVVRFAQQQLGDPYKYAGCTPGGFDCSGFTRYVLNNFGIELSSGSYNQEGYGKAIKLEEAQAGDLIFFRRKKGGRVFHVALVVEQTRSKLKVIHSTSSRGVVEDDLYASSYWKSKIMTARAVI